MLEANKPVFEYNHYVEGKQSYRQYEMIFLYHNGLFCRCCGVQLGYHQLVRMIERLRRIQTKQKAIILKI